MKDSEPLSVESYRYDDREALLSALRDGLIAQGAIVWAAVSDEAVDTDIEFDKLEEKVPVERLQHGVAGDTVVLRVVNSGAAAVNITVRFSAGDGDGSPTPSSFAASDSGGDDARDASSASTQNSATRRRFFVGGGASGWRPGTLNRFVGLSTTTMWSSSCKMRMVGVLVAADGSAIAIAKLSKVKMLMVPPASNDGSGCLVRAGCPAAPSQRRLIASTA